MVKLYTTLDKFEGKDGIIGIDDYFEINVTTDIITDTVKNVLYNYENAKVIGDNLLSGNYGVYRLCDISSGLKTLIILILIFERKLEKSNYINIFESGKNLMNEILKYLDKLSLPVYIRNSHFYGISNEVYDIMVDDIYKVNDLDDLVDILVEIYVNN